MVRRGAAAPSELKTVGQRFCCSILVNSEVFAACHLTPPRGCLVCRVQDAVRATVDTGRTVVCTIHQVGCPAEQPVKYGTVPCLPGGQQLLQ